MITNPIFFVTQKFSIAAKSFMSISIFCTFSSKAVPALPGDTYTFSTSLSCAAFHAKACSLPPDPITRTSIMITNVESDE